MPYKNPEDQKAWREKQKLDPGYAQKIRSYHKTWRETHSAQWAAISKKAVLKWRKANPEKQAAMTKRWIDNHKAADPEAFRAAGNARNQAWRDADPNRWRDMMRKARHKRRALLAGNSAPGVTREQWSEILEYFNHQCAYCLAPANHCDHIVPIAKGGADEASNVVPACARCNKSKGAKSLLVWLLTSKIAQQAIQA